MNLYNKKIIQLPKILKQKLPNELWIKIFDIIYYHLRFDMTKLKINKCSLIIGKGGQNLMKHVLCRTQYMGLIMSNNDSYKNVISDLFIYDKYKSNILEKFFDYDLISPCKNISILLDNVLTKTIYNTDVNINGDKL